MITPAATSHAWQARPLRPGHAATSYHHATSGVDTVQFSSQRAALPANVKPVGEYQIPHANATMHLYRFDKGPLTGMRVAIIPRHQTPFVSLAEIVHTGSTAEDLNHAGIAHFVEHLVLQRSPEGYADYIAALQSLGASAVNATTSFDHTNYFVEHFPKDQLIRGLDIFAKMLDPSFQKITEKLVEKERGVILEERQLDDTPERQLLLYHYNQLFGNHPYGRPIIGNKQSIQEMSLAAVNAFYLQHYGPANRTVLIVGDVTPKQALAGLEQTHTRPGTQSVQSIAKKTGLPMAKTPAVALGHLKRDPVASASLRIGYRIPGSSDTSEAAIKERTALGLLAYMLGGGRTSLLPQQLIEDQQLASSTDSYTVDYNDGGMFINTLYVEPGQLQTALDAYHELLAKFKADDTELIEAARNQIEHQQHMAFETHSGVYHWALSNLEDHTDFDTLPKTLDTALALFHSVPIETIQEVARKYLTPKNESIIALMPTDSPELVPHRHRANAGTGVKFSGRLPADVHSQRVNGSEVLVKHEPNAARQVITIQLKHGRINQREHAPLDYLTSLWLRRTGSKTYEEFQRYLDKHAITLSISSGKETSYIDVSGLSTQMEPLLEVLSELMAGPTFTEADLQKLKKLHRPLLQEHALQPATLLYEAVSKVLLGENHPLNYPTQTYIDALDTLDSASITSAFQHWYQPEKMTFGFIGPIDNEKASALVNQWHGTLKKATQGNKSRLSEKPSDSTPVTIPPISHNQMLTLASTRAANANIEKTWLAPALQDADRWAFSLLQGILGGSAGQSRLFRRFRGDDNALCYSVGAYYIKSHVGGTLTAYTHTDPKNVPVALVLFDEEINRLKTEPLSQQELDLARQESITDLIRFNESRDIQVDTVSYHRLWGDASPEEAIEKLKAVTPEDIQRVAKKYLSKPSITGMIAPPGALEAIGIPQPKPGEPAMELDPEIIKSISTASPRA